MSSGQHLLQLYRSTAFLSDAVADFLVAGLACGESAVVIASPRHRETICFSLKQRAVAVEELLANGTLRLFDAQSTSNSICANGSPDRQQFFSHLASLLSGLKKSAGARVYGETVGLMLASGDHTGAEQLEELWNELAKRDSLTLLSGFSQTAFDDREVGLTSPQKRRSDALPAEQAVDTSLAPS